MDYSKLRVQCIDALCGIAFNTDDLPAGSQYRIKAIESLFELARLAASEDRADAYRQQSTKLGELSLDELKALSRAYENNDPNLIEAADNVL